MFLSSVSSIHMHSRKMAYVYFKYEIRIQFQGAYEVTMV